MNSELQNPNSETNPKPAIPKRIPFGFSNLLLGQQTLLFLTLRLRVARNQLRSLMGGSLIQPVAILACSISIWAFVFFISFEGFSFMKQHDLALTDRFVGLVLDLLFFSLGVFLVFSTGLILYGSLFTSAETAFLLSKPAAADQLFAYKFQGAVLFSSWAFLLLGGPILIAYGLVAVAPWYFYALLPLFFFGFVLLPGSLGALLCLLVVNYVPRQRKQVLLGVVLVLSALVVAWVWQVVRHAPTETVDREALTRLVGWFSFARSALTPSHWISAGLRSTARADLGGAAYYLALLWGNGLFLYLVSALASVRLYRRGYNRLATGGSLRKRYGRGAWMDHLLRGVLFAINERTRLLIIKDFRTFRRDPQQWGQVLIFTGLMVLYFTNIRRMFPGDFDWTYQNIISVLNLCAVALLLCSYTGRFVYPMLSLEGRKFWILGLLPLDREQLLWGKFVFATTMTLGLAETLTIISDLMLAMPWVVVVIHALTVLVLAAGLSGLSVGMGAWLPNFRESDPSKIAVGFGGTLNLVVGLVFLLAIILLMVGPWHLLSIAHPDTLETGSYALVAMGLLAGLALGATAIILPLQLGVRTLRSLEF
jgi:ABC-2 type transport system permease protein